MKNLSVVLALTLLALFGCKLTQKPPTPTPAPDVVIPNGGKLGAGTYTPRQLLPQVPGTPGQILQLGVDLYGHWEDGGTGGGGGGGGSFLAIPGVMVQPPPTSSGWEFVNNVTNPTTATDIPGGIQFTVHNAVTAGNGYVRAGSGSPTMSVEIGEAWTSPDTVAYGSLFESLQGVMMYEQATGKYLELTYGYVKQTSGSSPGPFFTLCSSPTLTLVGQTFGVISTNSMPFMRLRLDGLGNVISEISVDRSVWTEIFTTTVSSVFTTAPDHIGYAFQGFPGVLNITAYDFVSDTTVVPANGSGGGGGPSTLAMTGTTVPPPPVSSGSWLFVNQPGIPSTAVDQANGTIRLAVDQTAPDGNGYVRPGSNSSTMSVEVGTGMMNPQPNNTTTTQAMWAGAMMYEVDSGKWLQLQVETASISTSTSLVGNYLRIVGSNAFIGGSQSIGNWSTWSQPFVRLILSGSNVLGQVSVDKQTWQTVWTTAITSAFNAAPSGGNPYDVGVALRGAVVSGATTFVTLYDFVTDNYTGSGPSGGGGGGGYVSPWTLPFGAGPLLASATPSASSFTAVNALGATLTTNAVSKTLQVLFPGDRNGGSNSRGYFYQANPTPPYTFTQCFVPTFGPNGVPLTGMMIGDTGNQIIEFAAYWNNGSPSNQFTVDKLTNPTTPSGSYRAQTMSVGATPYCLQIVDHGTGLNLDFNYSIDGAAFLPFTSQARSDFLGTINKIGIIGDDLTSVTGTNLAVTVFDWTAH
jgi:hypothetical protein